MTSSKAPATRHPLARLAGRVLYVVAIGLFGGYLGFSHGWDAARNAEPHEVHMSVECEPPPVI